MLNLNSVMISTMEPEALAAFYAKVFDRPADMEDADNGFHGWQAGAGFLGVLRHSQMVGKAINPGRMMFNLETADVQGDYARILGHGATSVAEPYAMGEGWIATLADPDGNYFQLMTPMA
jgi:predicted enzyme related to lactoylglutathione lyase